MIYLNDDQVSELLHHKGFQRWTEIAERLAGCGLKVTQRSVREKFDKLMKDFLKKESEEKNKVE